MDWLICRYIVVHSILDIKFLYLYKVANNVSYCTPDFRDLNLLFFSWANICSCHCHLVDLLKEPTFRLVEMKENEETMCRVLLKQCLAAHLQLLMPISNKLPGFSFITFFHIGHLYIFIQSVVKIMYIVTFSRQVGLFVCFLSSVLGIEPRLSH